jgi:hypothetical protein
MIFDVVISQAPKGEWLVRWQRTNSAVDFASKTFKCKQHALALGRALAYSSCSDLYLVDAAGMSIAQSRTSMTYSLLRD